MKPTKFSKPFFRLLLILSFVSPTAFSASEEETKKNAEKEAEKQTQGLANSYDTSGFDSVDSYKSNPSSSSGSASSGAIQQGLGALGNAFMGYQLTSMAIKETGIAASCSPKGLCEYAPLAMAGVFAGMSALAGLQADEHNQTSTGNLNKANAFRTNPLGNNRSNNNPNINNPTIPTQNDTINPEDKTRGANATNNPELYNALTKMTQKNLETLESKGIKVDPKTGTVTLPNGQTITANDIANPSKLDAKLGLPSGTSQKANEMATEALQQQAQKLGLGDGLAGVSMASALGLESDGDVAGPAGLSSGKNALGSKGALAAANSRLPASALIVGLTSKYNGENIGVSADNIFMMVKRRYQLKQDQDSFLSAERP